MCCFTNVDCIRNVWHWSRNLLSQNAPRYWPFKSITSLVGNLTVRHQEEHADESGVISRLFSVTGEHDVSPMIMFDYNAEIIWTVDIYFMYPSFMIKRVRILRFCKADWHNFLLICAQLSTVYEISFDQMLVFTAICAVSCDILRWQKAIFPDLFFENQPWWNIMQKDMVLITSINNGSLCMQRHDTLNIISTTI